MGPDDAIRTALRRSLDFRGRSSRAEFWWWLLLAAIVVLLLGAEISLLDGIVWLLVAIPTLAVATRRLHDSDASAWNLLWVIVPVLGNIVLLIRFVQPGTPGSNRFGSPMSGTVTTEDRDQPPPAEPTTD